MNTELDFSNAEALDVSNADATTDATTQATVKAKPKLDFKKLQNIADTVKKASIKVAPILEGVKNNFAKNAGKKEEPKKEEPKKEELKKEELKKEEKKKDIPNSEGTIEEIQKRVKNKQCNLECIQSLKTITDTQRQTLIDKYLPK